jgi:hypothetical protein
MACQVDISLEVRFVPMDEIQVAAWRAGLLLLLNYFIERNCDVANDIGAAQ